MQGHSVQGSDGVIMCSQAAIAPAPFPRGTSPLPGHSTLGAPPGKVPNPRLNGTSTPAANSGDGSAPLPAPMGAPVSRVRQTGELEQAPAKSFQAVPGKEPNPRLTNGTHPGTPRPPPSFVEQLQGGAPANAPSSGGAPMSAHPASVQHGGGGAAGSFQAKPGNVTNPRLKNSTGAVPPTSHNASSTMLSTVTGLGGSSSPASAANDGGTGIATPDTVKRVEGDTVLVTQVPAPEDGALGSKPAPASSAVVQPAPAQAPLLARPELRPPHTSKTAPVILESIPLQATLEQLESTSRGLLAAGSVKRSGATSETEMAASAPAPPPASSASSMAAFRSALAAELSAASQAGYHP